MTGEQKEDQRERLTRVRKGNAIVTLHLTRAAAESIKAKESYIPFQHGQVKVKWGNPEIILKKDPTLSANNTPLGIGGPGAGWRGAL